jgi:hypothetical protein
MKQIIFAAALFLFATVGQARIGWTLEQCNAALWRGYPVPGNRATWGGYGASVRDM